jgi:hypothetical protein
MEILAEFYVTRLEAYAKRRRHLIHSYEGELAYINAKIKFVEAVLQNKIDIRGVKAKILEQAHNQGLSMELAEEFVKMPLISLSKEMVDAMKKKEQHLQMRLRETVKTTAEDFYRADLKELMKTKTKKRKRDDD